MRRHLNMFKAFFPDQKVCKHEMSVYPEQACTVILGVEVVVWETYY